MAAESWIQFAILMTTIIGLALHAERRFTRMETRIDVLWQVYLETIGATIEQRPNPFDHRS